MRYFSVDRIYIVFYYSAHQNIRDLDASLSLLEKTRNTAEAHRSRLNFFVRSGIYQFWITIETSLTIAMKHFMLKNTFIEFTIADS